MKKNIGLLIIGIFLGVFTFNLNIIYADNTPYPKDNPKKEIGPFEVCVYTAAGYFGLEKCWARGEGPFLINKFPPEFINTISSIRIGERVGCLMFEHEIYGGDRFFCTKNILDLSQEKNLPGWNDQIESLQIIDREGTLSNPNEVCFYPAAGYIGRERCYEIEPWQRYILVDKLPPDFSNTISSLKLGSNVQCDIYEDTNFSGDHLWIKKYIVDLDKFTKSGKNWNDRAESLVIYRKNGYPGGVSLHENFNREGDYQQFFPLPEWDGSFSQKKTLLSERWKKNLQSVKFDIGSEDIFVDLYDTDGNVLTLPTKVNISDLYFLEPINWYNRVQAIRVYAKPPPRIETAAPKPSPQHDKATDTSYVASLLAKQYPNLSGKWNSNIGLEYQISQNGNKISYQDPMMHKPVNGTVDGKTVTVSWMEGSAMKSLKGTITIMGNDNMAKQINWINGAIFNRMATSPSMTATPKSPQQSVQTKIATGYVMGKVAKKYPELSGTWNSNIGLEYQISQNENKISYQDPLMHKPVNGTVDGNTVTVSWMEGNAIKNLKGNITKVGNDGKAKSINWANGVIFHR